jgi:pimeloyl-ACP methyl ester carboxylesterase
VTALGLVDGGWSSLRDGFPSWEACAKRLRPPDLASMTAERMRTHLRRAHPDWEAWAIEATLANLRVTPDGHLERRLPIPQHMQILRSMWDDPPRPYFPDVGVPVLLVPAGDREVSTDGLADARVRAYPGADHDLHAQHPDQLADDLRSLP